MAKEKLLEVMDGLRELNPAELVVVRQFFDLLNEESVNVNDAENKIIEGKANEPRSISKIGDFEIEQEITKFMNKIGMAANLKGFNYLRTAILMVVKDQTNIEFITKRLYPNIAIIYKTTSSRVERGIRHSIERAWAYNPYIKQMFLYVNPSAGKPTNSELIANIADDIRMKLRIAK